MLGFRFAGFRGMAGLVGVLQRVGIQPSSPLPELTQRQWNHHFADQPLRLFEGQTA